MTDSLEDYAENVHSQEGEDGILRELFEQLDIDQGRFCEFGAWDGKHLSNTYRLLSEEGWDGVMIEADEEEYESLSCLEEESDPRLQTFNKFVEPTGENSLDSILSDSFLSKDFDILSVDINGPDYYVWKNLSEYRPKVVVIEYNQCLGPEVRYATDITDYDTVLSTTSPHSGAGTRTDPVRGWGSSFRSLVELGEDKGYSLVAATRLNLIFLRDDFVDDVDSDDAERTPTSHFDEAWDSSYCDPTPEPLYRKHPLVILKLGIEAIWKRLPV